MAAPTKPTAAVTVADQDTTSATVQAYTTGADDTYMIVRIAMRRGSPTVGSVASVTFGATPLSLLKTQADTNVNMRATMYGGFVSANTTANVTVTYSGGGIETSLVAITSYVGVISTGTASADLKTTGTTTANALTGVEFARCIDMVLTHTGDNNPTPGGTQVAEFTRFAGTGPGGEMDGSFQNASTSMNWTGMNHANDDSISIAVPLVGLDDAAAAGGGGAMTNKRLHKISLGF